MAAHDAIAGLVVAWSRDGASVLRASAVRHELVHQGLVAAVELPSESAVYRCLVQSRLIERIGVAGGAERFKRWKRAAHAASFVACTQTARTRASISLA
jgi:hypothetical protein